MKKILSILAVSLLLVSCVEDSKWEYKVLKIAGVESESGSFGSMTFDDPTGQLNKLGDDGWEVVSSYTEENTVHPNFGNSEYVTGLQPNTRTATVNFVLKRKIKSGIK